MDPATKTKNNNRLEKQEVLFTSDNNKDSTNKNIKNKTILVKSSINDSAENIIGTLELPFKPQSIILVFGGASGSLDTSSASLSILYPILDTVLQYALDNDAIIIDGGTKSGIMELVGQRAIEMEQNKKPVLLGVAPAGLVVYPNSSKEGDKWKEDIDKADLDPNHSHFVLVEGDKWGDETSKLFEIATALASTGVDNIPIVALLAGGGQISKKEMLFCINKSWPIIVIEKTGYLADEIASCKRQNLQNMSNTKIKKIVSYPSLKLFPFDSNQQKKSSFEQFLLYTLNYDPLLESAWKNMAIYDKSAKILQCNFNRFQKFILGIGVLATLLAIIQSQFKVSPSTFFVDILYYVLIVLPIIISILIAALNRFR